MNYSIEPQTMTIPGVGTVTLSQIAMVVNYQIGMTQMIVPYSLCDADGATYWDGMTTISQSELANWGTDDMYIVNLVATAAGVTLA